VNGLVSSIIEGNRVVEVKLKRRSQKLFSNMANFFSKEGAFSFPLKMENLCEGIGVQVTDFDGSTRSIFDHDYNIGDYTFSPCGARELSCFVGDEPRLFINKNLGRRRKRFALAHGLYHLVSDKEGQEPFDFEKSSEEFVTIEEMNANAFASALLQPPWLFERSACFFTFIDLAKLFGLPISVVIARAFIALDRPAIAVLSLGGKVSTLMINPEGKARTDTYSTVGFDEVTCCFRKGYPCFVLDSNRNTLPGFIEKESSMNAICKLGSAGKMGAWEKNHYYMTLQRLGPIRGSDVYGERFSISGDLLFFLHATGFMDEDLLTKKKGEIDVIIAVEDGKQELARLWQDGHRPLLPPSCLMRKGAVSSLNPLEIYKETKKRPFDVRAWWDLLLKIATGGAV